MTAGNPPKLPDDNAAFARTLSPEVKSFVVTDG
jgi:hypothetical protein